MRKDIPFQCGKWYPIETLGAAYWTGLFSYDSRILVFDEKNIPGHVEAVELSIREDMGSTEEGAVKWDLYWLGSESCKYAKVDFITRWMPFPSELDGAE